MRWIHTSLDASNGGQWCNGVSAFEAGGDRCVCEDEISAPFVNQGLELVKAVRLGPKGDVVLGANTSVEIGHRLAQVVVKGGSIYKAA